LAAIGKSFVEFAAIEAASGSQKASSGAAMDYQQILYSLQDSILTITLHRPERLNAFTTQMCRELLDAFDRADVDDSVRVVIVTGAGRAFCAGADLGGADSFDSPARRRAAATADHRDGGGLLTLRIYDSKKPVIAAINGPAVGVGVTMTLPMDVRIASSAARMGFVFVRRGIVPEAASSWFLPRVVGVSRAAEWAYTGRVFPAEEALEGGLVSRVVAPQDLLPTARALAREIADNTSAVSVALTRQMLWKMLAADHPMEAHRIDSKAVHWMGRSADAYEGVASFLEKRAPKFKLKPSEMPEFYPWWTPREFK
jgi:enoyl-CoA hydratase/carnithine racemase